MSLQPPDESHSHHVTCGSDSSDMRLFIYSKSILTSVLMHSNISPLLQVDHKTLTHKTLKELCFLYQSIDLKYKTCHIRVTCQIAWLQLMQWILLHVSWSIPVCDFIYFCHNLFDNAVTFIKLCLVASQCPVLFTLLSLSLCLHVVVYLFVGLFVCKILQKLLNRFPPNCWREGDH